MSVYDKYDNGGSSGNNSDDNDDDDRTTLSMSPYAMIEVTQKDVYVGNGDWQQSLGVQYDDVEIIDGVIYENPDNGNLKVFAWKDILGKNPMERYENGTETHATEAREVNPMSFGGTQINYELRVARVPEIEVDGEVVVESSAVVYDGDDMEEIDPDNVGIGNVIVWNKAGEHGATSKCKAIAKRVTLQGPDILNDVDDRFNWLNKENGNIVRPEIEDRRFRYWQEQRDGEEHQFTMPVFEDVDLGNNLGVNNDNGGDNGSSSSDNAASEDTSGALEEGSEYPQPIQDFINVASNGNLPEESAEEYLEDLISDDDNPLTQDVAEEYGGLEGIMSEAGY